jgi:hypothetical protein
VRLAFDGIVAGGQPAITISFAENLEHRDGIFPGGKVGVVIVGQAECVPARPMFSIALERCFVTMARMRSSTRPRSERNALACAGGRASRVDSEGSGEQNWQGVESQINATEGCRHQASAMALASPPM